MMKEKIKPKRLPEAESSRGLFQERGENIRFHLFVFGCFARACDTLLGGY